MRSFILLEVIKIYLGSSVKTTIIFEWYCNQTWNGGKGAGDGGRRTGDGGQGTRTGNEKRARCNWPQLLRCPCQRSFCLFVCFFREANKIK